MASDESERLLNEIGQLLAEDTEYPLEGTLLYAFVDTNMVGASVFKNRGNHVLYRRDLDRFTYPLLDLWEEEEPGKRWAEIEYVIRNGKFDATFTYPDEIDREEEPLERRNRIVRRHFGDKPIIFPPWSDGDDDIQQFEL